MVEPNVALVDEACHHPEMRVKQHFCAERSPGKTRDLRRVCGAGADEGGRVNACRSCHAPIRWARTSSGKAIPLDPNPADDGNVRLGWVGGEELALVLAAGELEAARVDGPLYRSHFASCPNAAAHRSRA